MPTGTRQKNKALYTLKTLYVKHKEIFIFHNKIRNPSIARIWIFMLLPQILNIGDKLEKNKKNQGTENEIHLQALTGPRASHFWALAFEACPQSDPSQLFSLNSSASHPPLQMNWSTHCLPNSSCRLLLLDSWLTKFLHFGMPPVTPLPSRPYP